MERVITVETTDNNEELEFTNSIVTQGREDVSHTVRVNEEAFTQSLGPGTGLLLPQGTRWMSVDGRSPLLNFYLNGQLCNPIYERYEYVEPTLQNGINAAYNLIWNSGFNFDLRDAVSQGAKQSRPFKMSTNATLKMMCRRFFSSWSKMSMGDVLQAEWPSAALDMRGDGTTDDLRISTVIDSVRISAMMTLPNARRQFMVHLVNTIHAQPVVR